MTRKEQEEFLLINMKKLSSKARDALKARADKEFKNAQGEWDKIDAAKQ